MNNNTCFVVMPIGTQTFNGITLTEEKLREKYDYIIKNAVLKADSTLEVIRADDEINPSSMSNDIFLKLMHSKYVIADITYPNPNVFYELGIRHAISNKTILIREKSDSPAPFDIAHLRYIEYTQEPSGMDKLSNELKKRFSFYDTNPQKVDNQFLELCTFTQFCPSVFNFEKKDSEKEILGDAVRFFLGNPKFLQACMNPNISEEERNLILFSELQKNPDLAAKMITSAMKLE